MTRHDMPERLASWAEALPDSVTSRLLREAADEIVSLRLTSKEREAVADAADRYAEVAPESAETAATLRGLLERLSPPAT